MKIRFCCLSGQKQKEMARMVSNSTCNASFFLVQNSLMEKVLSDPNYCLLFRPQKRMFLGVERH